MSAYPVCEKCGCRLARHSYSRGQTTCWPCGGGTYTTHLDFIDAEGTRERGPGRGNTPGGVCQRGHDLEHHGVIVNTGEGRTSRKCGACRNLAARRRLDRERISPLATPQRQTAQMGMIL